jgi:hypothetical protein
MRKEIAEDLAGGQKYIAPPNSSETKCLCQNFKTEIAAGFKLSAEVSKSENGITFSAREH